MILGFNEPNHADQSDISPETAAAAWIEIQVTFSHSMRAAVVESCKNKRPDYGNRNFLFQDI